MLSRLSTEFSIEGMSFETGRPVRIAVKDGYISSVEELSSDSAEALNIIIAPGFIDNQVNGCAGVDFSGSSLTPSMVVEVSRAMFSERVTTFLPTLITAEHD